MPLDSHPPALKEADEKGDKAGLDVGRVVVRQQPRALAAVHGEEVGSQGRQAEVVQEQDVTEYRRRQVEAYSNLEDLLDVAWEEEDLAPPTKVGAIVAKCNGVLSKP